MIVFNQNAWLKSYIDMNRSKKKAINDIEDFFKFMNNAVFGKKLWKMRENVEISNLWQLKEE